MACVQDIINTCLNQQHDYRGGEMPIGPGVFNVSLTGLPPEALFGEGKDGILSSNVTALEERASALQTPPDFRDAKR